MAKTLPTKADDLNTQATLLRAQGVPLDEIRRTLSVLIDTVREEGARRFQEARGR